MKWQRRIPYVFAFFLMSCLIARGVLTFTLAYTSYCFGYAEIYIPSPLGISFQNDEYRLVTVSISSGLLNSSRGDISLHSGGGYFKFASLDSATLLITHVNISTIKIGGDMGNSFRAFESGQSFPIQSGDNVQIIWEVTLEPYLPIMFILGIVGLIGMFGGPAYTITKAKAKEYREGFITGLIITASGLALFISWVGSV